MQASSMSWITHLGALAGAAALVGVLSATNGDTDFRDAGERDAMLAPPARADTITPEMIALGDDIFHGKKAGALCATCHGKGGRGVPGMGPNLADGTWLHGDGSLAFLETIIRSGVMKPKAGAAIMPPFGGPPLSPAQLKAVAAYVYSLSRSSGAAGSTSP